MTSYKGSENFLFPYKKLRRQTHVFTSSLCELAESAKRSFFTAFLALRYNLEKV